MAEGHERHSFFTFGGVLHGQLEPTTDVVYNWNDASGQAQQTNVAQLPFACMGGVIVKQEVISIAEYNGNCFTDS